MRKRDLMWINRGSGGGGSAPVTLQDKTFTENGTYTADEGYSGLGNVTVDVESSGGGAKDIILLRNETKENICTMVIDDSVRTDLSLTPGGPFFGPTIYVTTDDFNLMVDIVNSGLYRFISLLTYSNADIVRISNYAYVYIDDEYPNQS